MTESVGQSAASTKRGEQTRRKLRALLDASEQKVFQKFELARLLRDGISSLGLPKSITLTRALPVLRDEGLRLVELSPASDASPALTSKVVRYVWGDPSMYALGLSLRADSYLSHASAVFVHGLSRQIPKTVYVNKEQSPKPPPQGPLTQEGIDKAFSNSQRASKYVLTYEGYRFVVVSGKWSNRLEVAELPGPQGEPLAATKLERTLIDIAVRPAYAGGVFEVLDAYRAAVDRISINTLVATLKALDYVYPYHQAIGFYLERAGYDTAKLSKLKALGLNFDFYLTHRMGPTSYSPDWRIYFPESL